MERTCRNTELSIANVGQVVTLVGWVSRKRNLGSILFIDLRDRSGIIQIYVKEGMEIPDVRSEYVISVTGEVAKRKEPNPKMKTGDIEIIASKIELINTAKTTPRKAKAAAMIKYSLDKAFLFSGLLQRRTMYKGAAISIAPKNIAGNVAKMVGEPLPKLETSPKNKLEAQKVNNEPITAITANEIATNFLLILLHLRICMPITMDINIIAIKSDCLIA